jgi:hypothetical protein
MPIKIRLPSKSAQALDRLPNAPLAEVVFEMRWALVGNSPFLTDPGVIPLLEAFTLAAKAIGYPSFRDMGNTQQMIGHSVARRYHRNPDTNFPMLQIGQGVFAVNQSSEYEWAHFKKLALAGLKALLQSYPELRGFPLKPNYIELRYIDAFDQSLTGTTDLIEFCQKATALGISLPAMLNDGKRFTGRLTGRLIVKKDLKSAKDTHMSIDIGSGRNENSSTDIVRLESKIVSEEKGIPSLATPGKFLDGSARTHHLYSQNHCRTF